MKRFAILASILLIIIVSVGLMFFYGIIWFNNPSKSDYPVRGIDISSYQGRIDWNKIKTVHLNFIIMKATEGKDFKDKCFYSNWINAKHGNYIVGAYHFFTFASPGTYQAANYIDSVPKISNMLAPLIDLEFDGNSKHIPSRENVLKELKIFIKTIETYYRVKPILYLTYESYEKFIKDEEFDLPIWIRDLFTRPNLNGNSKWVFWQYNNRGRIQGIKHFVDLNVFNGNTQELENYLISK